MNPIPKSIIEKQAAIFKATVGCTEEEAQYYAAKAIATAISVLERLGAVITWPDIIQ